MWVQGDWIELPRADVKLKEKLGEGAFGEVYKGEVQIDGEKLPCAVKRVKGKLSLSRSFQSLEMQYDRRKCLRLTNVIS